MRVLSIFIMIMFVIGCSKKKEEFNFKNTNIPSDKNFSVVFKKKITIPYFSNTDTNSTRNIYAPYGISIDKKSNIYVTDMKSNTIKKFDKSGSFVKSFGGNGDGPGECRYINSVLLMNDTIYISDVNRHKIIKFNTQGKNLTPIKFEKRAPKFLKPVGNNEIIGFRTESEQKNNKTYLISYIILYDLSFKQLIVLDTHKVLIDSKNYNLNPLDIIPFYCADNKYIYIGEINENIFKVKVFDFTGKYLYDIAKNYKKIPISNNQRKSIQKTVNGSNKGNMIKNKIKTSYNKAINGIFLDKNDRLWVLTFSKKQNDKLCFDIFKNGKFLNTIDLSIYKGNKKDYTIMWDIFFEKEYIGIINRDDEVIELYDY